MKRGSEWWEDGLQAVFLKSLCATDLLILRKGPGLYGTHRIAACSHLLLTKKLSRGELVHCLISIMLHYVFDLSRKNLTWGTRYFCLALHCLRPTLFIALLVSPALLYTISSHLYPLSFSPPIYSFSPYSNSLMTLPTPMHPILHRIRCQADQTL